MEMTGRSRMIIATTVLLLVLCHQQYGAVQLNVVASASTIEMVTTSDGESTLKPNAKTDANTIIRAAFNSTIVYTRLASLTDTFGPRFSGTSALESALDWIKDEAENGDGFSVKEQTVMVPVWVRGKEYANLISPRHKSMRVLGLGGSVGTNGHPIQAKVLVVSSFDDLEKQKLNVSGKIVVYNEEFVSYSETAEYRYFGASRAQQYGAVAALIRSISPFGLQTPHTGSSEPTTIPAMAITLEDAQMFARMQARGQDVEIELYMEAHTLPDSPSRNLILEIEGSRFPDEYVIVGGHTDSWDIADGAIDDGGGAFVSWEALRLIKSSGFANNFSIAAAVQSGFFFLPHCMIIPFRAGQLLNLFAVEISVNPKPFAFVFTGLNPDRTIRAVLFVNEENGAKGGQQYASDYSYTLSKTSIALESDTGTFTPDGISFSGSSKARRILKYIGKELLAGIGSGNVSGEGVGEDIYYMCETGVPCGNLNVFDPRTSHLSNNPCLPYSQPPYPAFNENVYLQGGYFW